MKLFKLLEITPIILSVAERRFLTLKRIKTCLYSSMREQRLLALSVLDTASETIREDTDFNTKKTIDHFFLNEKLTYRLCS